MRLLFWMIVALSAVFAILVGIYVHYWAEDAYPLNLVFFGQRFTICLGLIAGLCVLGLAAAALTWFGTGGLAQRASR